MTKIPNLERRPVEFRAIDSSDGKMIIEGYAIVFDSPATHQIGDYSFTETISRNALNGTDLKDVPLKYNHSDNFLIMARTRNKSLQLIIDETGLKIRAELIDTQSNRDVFKAVSEGLVDKMSFAFTIEENGDKWEYSKNATSRTVNKINRIYDVSVVDTPFYDTTTVSARGIEQLENYGNFKSEDFEMRKRKMLLKMKMMER